MVPTKNKQKILAAPVLALYLFVALFSQNFHEHKRSELFGDFKYQQTKKVFSSESSVVSYSDCLSCHVLHEGKHLSFTSFQCSLFFAEKSEQVIVFAEDFLYRIPLFNTAVRGPPAISFL